MANVMDGGSGDLFAGVGQAFRNVGNTVKKTAKKSSGGKRRRSSSTGSGMGKASKGLINGVSNVARQTGNSARRRRSSSGGSFRSAGSGSGYRSAARPNVSRPPSGSTAGGAIVPTVPAPVVPKFDQAYLAGDTAYSSQKSAYDKALADFAARSQGKLTDYNTEYTTKLADMQKAQDQGALDLKDDYAARGLLSSGVYGDALNDFNNSYTSQRNELARAKQQYETDMTNQKTDFTTDQNILLQKAKQDALNRYNDKYKV